jgi:hypothetical protein
MNTDLKFVLNFSPQLLLPTHFTLHLKIILPIKDAVKTRVKEQRTDRRSYMITVHYKLQVGLRNKCILYVCTQNILVC